MKIKFVDYPVIEYPECLGSYDRENKFLLIKKNRPKLETFYTIFHEFIHYLIDLLPIIPKWKHYLNLSWEIFDVILFRDICSIKRRLKFYIDYYEGYRKIGIYVY